MGTQAGVFGTRAVRRLVPDRCWSKAANNVIWMPWHTAATIRGRLPTARNDEVSEPFLNTPSPTDPGAYRDLRPRMAAAAAAVAAPVAVPAAAHAPEAVPAAASMAVSPAASVNEQMERKSARTVGGTTTPEVEHNW